LKDLILVFGLEVNPSILRNGHLHTVTLARFQALVTVMAETQM
jgi:hypothetical protein